MSKVAAIDIYLSPIGESYYLPTEVSDLVRATDGRTKLGRLNCRYDKALSELSMIAFEIGVDLKDILPK